MVSPHRSPLLAAQERLAALARERAAHRCAACAARRTKPMGRDLLGAVAHRPERHLVADPVGPARRRGVRLGPRAARDQRDERRLRALHDRERLLREQEENLKETARAQGLSEDQVQFWRERVLGIK